MTSLRIEKMIYGGEGLTATGEAVPFVLPGELVQLEAGAVAKIIESSPDRVAPACVHFSACGGCHYQHASYAAQLRLKTEILRDTLMDAGLTELPEIAVHSGEPWGYRNRIRLRLGQVDGELRVGYNRVGAAGGAAMLPIVMCPIAAPVLWRAAAALLALAKTTPVVQEWLAAAVEVELFANADESALQLTLFTRKPPAAGFAACCSALQGSVPELVGGGVALLPKNPSPQGRRAEQAKAGAQWGTPGLLYTVAGDQHWVSRGAFFQVNRHVVAALLQLVVGERKGALCWDLYAGVGLFSRELAKHFVEVLAVEAGTSAATDLAAALKGKGSRALAMTTLDFLSAAVVQRERPGLIVIDPPRAGVGPEVCALLARVRCKEIVYVSCDPTTLARDLKHLINDGYRVEDLHLVDMFPQTFHLETVAVLRR